MNDSYRTLANPSQGMFRDRNSRFMAFAYPVQSLSEVNDILAGLRKKYHDARHHCYAYRINPEKEQCRLNDDGEPSGTAGKPIYNQIVSNDLYNVLLVVVRYFGGTLLGTGGLINAYKSASMEALGSARIIEKFLENRYTLLFTYEKLSPVLKILKEENLVASDQAFDAQCSLSVSVRRSISDAVVRKLISLGDIHIKLLQSD